MKEVQVSDGIVPLGEFKSQAAKLLKCIAESGQPMVITQNGRPAGVLVSPREFDRIQERQRFLESIAAGLADAEAGGVMDTAALRKLIRPRRALAHVKVVWAEEARRRLVEIEEFIARDRPTAAAKRID